MTTAMRCPDWQPPTADLPAPADVGGVPHRSDRSPGYRCACGAATLAATTHGQPTHAGHEPAIDAVSAADPATDPAYLEQYAACDRATWDALVARTDHTPKLLEWLVRQALGWPDYGYASRSSLYLSLLRSGIVFSEADLITFTASDSAPDAECAVALLAQPAATPRVVCALAGSVMNSWGGSRFEAEWGGRAQERIADRLRQDERSWVRVPATIRRQGLRHWPPALDGSLRTSVRAQESFTEAMVTIAGYGDAGWRLAEESLLRVHGPDLVTLVRGVLDRSTS